MKILWQYTDEIRRSVAVAEGRELGIGGETEIRLDQIPAERRADFLRRDGRPVHEITCVVWSDASVPRYHDRAVLFGHCEVALYLDTPDPAPEQIVAALLAAWDTARAAWETRAAELVAEGLAALAARETIAHQEAEDARQAREIDARRQQIVREHGTESQRERLDAGVLPDDELRQVVADWVHRDVKGIADVSLTGADLVAKNGGEENCLCADEGHDVGCDVTVATEVPPYEWEVAKSIRATLPEGATSEIRYHDCNCRRRGCDAVAHRYGLRVTIEHGPLSVSREYALTSLRNPGKRGASSPSGQQRSKKRGQHLEICRTRLG